VSVASSGAQAASDSGLPFWPSQSISAEGRYIAFDSASSNLVPGDTNGESDVFVRDRVEGTTERVSLHRGAQIEAGGELESLSADGRFVVFSSNQNVYLYDRATSKTELVSVPIAPTKIGPVTIAPGTPVAGKPLVAIVPVTVAGKKVATAAVSCPANVAGLPLRPASHTFKEGRARCVWNLPRRATGEAFYGSVIAVTPNGSAEARVSVTLAGKRAGLAWRIVAIGSSVPALSDVTVVSSTNVWAVGGGADFSGVSGGASYTETPPVIVHWNGRRLRSMKPFEPSLGNGQMTGIAALAGNDIWAVGNDYKSYTVGRPVAVHWDGRRWQRAQLPTTSGWLYDLTAIATDDVWAVGQAASRPLVLHWNGRVWTAIATPAPGSKSALYAVDGGTAKDVWALGGKNLAGPSYGQEELMLHWDGRRWSNVSRADIAVGDALDARVTNEVWALSFDWDSPADTSGNDLLVRWDRRGPGSVHRYVGAGNLDDIAAVSARSVWAVGARSWEPDYPLVVLWNGKSMRIQPAFANLRARNLHAVEALSKTEVWAVGDHLVARYSR
jgi:hypothetical protein